MPVVDIHVHIYPAKISAKAVDSVRQFYCLERMSNEVGTAEAMLETTKDSPITHMLVHSVAVKPKTVTSINDFIASECAKHPNLIGFAAMHQDFEDPETELKRAKAMGLHGIKLHPDTQGVYADDPRLMNVYEIAQDMGMAVIIHTGDYRHGYSHPKRVRNVVRAFPELRVDAAHFGGWSIYDIGYDLLHEENCFVDTSSSFQMTGLRHGRELINMFGTDRVLFGSDFPMWNPVDEYEALRAMDFDQETWEKLTWHNAEAFLGMKIE